MSVTYFSSNKVLDYNFGITSYSPPATLYFALSTTSPDISGSNFTEPSSGAYARVGLTNNKTNWTTAASGILTNSTAVNFVESTASWGTVVSVGLFDSLTGGNLLWYDVLSPARTISTATTVLFAIGAISVQFNNS
jgi:hypothetical protein